MLSTMQDVPLLISRILTHGSTIHGSSQVITWTGEAEPHRRSFAEIGTRSAQLAHALTEDLGVREDDRVATLAWNNAEHVEAYFAVPSMGAVLHTLNLRLPAEQLAWIVNHAADRVVIANGSLIPLLAPSSRTSRPSSMSSSPAPATGRRWKACGPAYTSTRS